MLQVSVEEYRERFIDDHYPLTQISVHRSVTQTFVEKATELKLNLTTRNVCDYLMHNANARKKTHTFGETSPIDNKAIADRLGKNVRTIPNEIVKLVKSDLIQRHRVKRNVYIIPSMLRARAELAEQAAMKRQINITKAAETRIEKLEADIQRSLTQSERKRVSAEVTLMYGKQNGNGKHPQKTDENLIEFPF